MSTVKIRNVFSGCEFEIRADGLDDVDDWFSERGLDMDNYEITAPDSWYELSSSNVIVVSEPSKQIAEDYRDVGYNVLFC